MISRLLKAIIFISVCFVGITSATTLLPITSNAADVAVPVTIPIDLPADQVGEFVAPLSEQQVRQLLIDKIAGEVVQNQTDQIIENISIIEMLKGVGNPYTPLGRAVAACLNSIDSYYLRVSEVINTLTGGKGWLGVLYGLAILALIAALAFAIEYLCLLRIRRSQLFTGNASETSLKSKIGYPFIVFLINFLGLVVFTFSGYIIAEFFKPEDSVEYLFLMEMFDWIIAIRFFQMLYCLMFKPRPLGLSLINQTINVSKLHRCMMLFTIIYICGSGSIELLAANGLSQEHTVLSLIVFAAVFLNPIVLWFVWTQRYDIDRSLFGDLNEKVCPVNGYRYAARAAIWPSVVTLVVTVGFFNWVIQLLLNNQEGIKAISTVWWITLLFPVIDLIVTSLLNNLVSMELFQHKRFQQRKQRFIFVIRSVIRLMLITILLFSLMSAWGFDLISKYRIIGGRDVVQTLIDIGAVILIGYIIWEVIQLWMERKLPDEPEEGVIEIEGEGGGAAATRTETLLPLFKTTLLIVLFLMVVMSVLYSLGIQIGPLLAGAGVVGIAVGFGAQKLVQDIISGVFFLIDDAFRKGEYVEVAGMRGTVEKLSVRSMRLRHHLGSVQTIPYGEIATVRNQSRDWVIMKLELRLPYDVDIEKVRKIIKKVGQEMLEDEETGPNMLQPLKSQGVMRVEESALIVRMKFTAKPGEQWIVRRVAYTKVRDALAAAGIEFAHREVKVRLPEELEHLQKMDYERKLKGDPEPNSEPVEAQSDQASSAPAAVAAAAMTAIVSSELAANNKIDEDSDAGNDDR